MSDLLRMKRAKELQKQAIAAAKRAREKLMAKVAAKDRLITRLEKYDVVTGTENRT